VIENPGFEVIQADNAEAAIAFLNARPGSAAQGDRAFRNLRSSEMNGARKRRLHRQSALADASKARGAGPLMGTR
jgi:hypothetical protein